METLCNQHLHCDLEERLTYKIKLLFCIYWGVVFLSSTQEKVVQELCACVREFKSYTGNHDVPVVWFLPLLTKSLSLAKYISEDSSQPAPVVVFSPSGGSFHVTKNRGPRVKYVSFVNKVL